MTKKIVSLAAGIFFVVAAAFSSSAAEFSWKELHEYADTIDSAQAAVLVEKEPDSIAQLYLAGVVSLNEYNPQTARAYFERILARDGKNLMALWGVAECQRRDYRFEEAEKTLKALIVRDPQFAPACISLGYIQYLRMDFKDAAETVAQVLRLGKGNVDLMNYVRAHSLYGGAKGMIAHYSGALSKAVNGAAVLRHLRISSNLLPDSAPVLFGYGSYYLLIPPMFGRSAPKAIDYLERAIGKDPMFVDAYVRLAQAYKLNGDIERYDEYLNKALQLDPRNIIALDIKNGTCRFICVEITD